MRYLLTVMAQVMFHILSFLSASDSPHDEASDLFTACILYWNSCNTRYEYELCQFWLKIQPAIWFPLFSTGAGCEVRGVSKCLHKRYKAQCPNIVSIGNPQDCPDANKPYCCKFRWHESQDQALATVTHVMKPNIAVEVTSVCIVP